MMYVNHTSIYKMRPYFTKWNGTVESNLSHSVVWYNLTDFIRTAPSWLPPQSIFSSVLFFLYLVHCCNWCWLVPWGTCQTIPSSHKMVIWSDINHWKNRCPNFNKLRYPPTDRPYCASVCAQSFASAFCDGNCTFGVSIGSSKFPCPFLWFLWQSIKIVSMPVVWLYSRIWL